VRDAPIGGSLVQSGIAAVCIVLFGPILGVDPIATVFTLLAGVAAVAILLLLVAASVAAIAWFRHGGGANETWWQRRIGPAVAVVAGALVLGTVVAKFGVLVGTGGHTTLSVALLGVVVLAVVAGLGWAAVLAVIRRDVYRAIGQGQPEDLELADRRLDEVRLWRRR
jgi:hypothetical protein